MHDAIFIVPQKQKQKEQSVHSLSGYVDIDRDKIECKDW